MQVTRENGEITVRLSEFETDAIVKALIAVVGSSSENRVSRELRWALLDHLRAMKTENTPDPG